MAIWRAISTNKLRLEIKTLFCFLKKTGALKGYIMQNHKTRTLAISGYYLLSKMLCNVMCFHQYMLWQHYKTVDLYWREKNVLSIIHLSKLSGCKQLHRIMVGLSDRPSCKEKFFTTVQRESHSFLAVSILFFLRQLETLYGQKSV